MNITTFDIQEEVLSAISSLGLRTFDRYCLPDGELSDERIAIAISEDKEGKIWDNCIVTISICVPDEIPHIANKKRLDILERSALSLLKHGVTGDKNGECYLLSLSSHSIEEDSQLRCHFVNIKLLFQTLNVIH